MKSLIFVGEEMTMLEYSGCRFIHICKIDPLRDLEGRPVQFMPQSRYRNKKGLALHKYGNGPFCKFDIPNDSNWRGKNGVYIILVNSIPKYVGQCANLAHRFRYGYGQIHPRNCFEGGQRTNCRINNLILKEAAKRGDVIELLFYETNDRARIEEMLIGELRPEWNG